MKNKRRHFDDLQKRSGSRSIELGFENSKGYVVAFIVLFHIIPLLTKLTSEESQLIINIIMLVAVNIIGVFVLCGIHGWKHGFSWKLPLIAILLFLPSQIMYTNIATPEELMYAIRTSVLYFIVYAVFGFGASAIGACIKKFL